MTSQCLMNLKFLRLSIGKQFCLQLAFRTSHSFNNFVSWGEAEQTRSQEPVELRNILFKALTHVRFPLMDAKQFALDIATKNVLDASELTSIFTGFYSTPEQRQLLPRNQFFVKIIIS